MHIHTYDHMYIAICVTTYTYTYIAIGHHSLHSSLAICIAFVLDVQSTLHPKCDLGNSSEECSNSSNHCQGWAPFGK